MQRSDLAAIKQLAVRLGTELGAAAVRIAPSFPDEASRERMKQSFERGDLATWKYDARYAETASDPSRILADARSVVCLAFPYATKAPPRPPLTGRVSNYAWSNDYHRRIRGALGVLATAIDSAAGESVTAIACDTKPIAERAFAARAGLGWIGKHTNLIAGKSGSFVFLGEIVTSLELEPDVPLRTGCGSCIRCVDACPTGALRGDYTIDATRCIADLTQRTDSIPAAMRPLLGDWVWGCDLCQVACPPTRGAGEQGGENAEPFDAQTAAPSLTRLLRLRSGEFKRRFAPTAMGWRGSAVLRRNAAVGLGNSLDRSAISPLAEALACDPHPMVRAHAAWALGRIAAPQSLHVLRDALEKETDGDVAQEIRDAMETLRPASPLHAS
ncbi:MAG: tRNA epoxyqueuosine(34) reductase QueG [Candidatus Eremiobacteraeota bacterium]|nr:tRNA epoxyqueuosine(34) reductase QueG [Candidatus Eremiobacteraeota bacterium]